MNMCIRPPCQRCKYSKNPASRSRGRASCAQRPGRAVTSKSPDRGAVFRRGSSLFGVRMHPEPCPCAQHDHVARPLSPSAVSNVPYLPTSTGRQAGPSRSRKEGPRRRAGRRRGGGGGEGGKQACSRLVSQPGVTFPTQCPPMPSSAPETRPPWHARLYSLESLVERRGGRGGALADWDPIRPVAVIASR